MAKIIEFPSPKKKKNEMDHELDIARELMNVTITTLNEYQYDVREHPEMIDDLGVIYHMFYAMMLRDINKEHPWHEMIDEIIREMKKDLDK